MISRLSRMFDTFTGRGDAAVTVPPLDGALRANRALDEAKTRLPLPDVDDLITVDGTVFVSAKNILFRLKGGDWQIDHRFDAPINAMAPLGDGGIAIALASGEILMQGGAHNGPRVQLPDSVRCITAMALSGSDLIVANGSAVNGAENWRRDLMQRNATGSLWRVGLSDGSATCLAKGLAWPAGVSVDAARLVISEAWAHRLVAIDPAHPVTRQILHADLPGYPGRLSPAADGYWLAVFAPRSQLVEFVLREPAYRKSMIAEVDPPFWIAPSLRSGRSFYEPLQGGSVKQLGILKPWAPTLSSGLCVQLDRDFQPVASFHSRADGATHGVTAVAEQDGQIYVAARGDGLVVELDTNNSDAAP